MDRIKVSDIQVGDIIFGLISENTVEVMSLPEWTKRPTDKVTKPRWCVTARLLDDEGSYGKMFGHVYEYYTVSESETDDLYATNIMLVKKYGLIPMKHMPKMEMS